MLNQTCASLNRLGNKIDLLNIFEPDTKYYQILFPLNSDCAPLDSKQFDLKSKAVEQTVLRSSITAIKVTIDMLISQCEYTKNSKLVSRQLAFVCFMSSQKHTVYTDKNV